MPYKQSDVNAFPDEMNNVHRSNLILDHMQNQLAIVVNACKCQKHQARKTLGECIRNRQHWLRKQKLVVNGGDKVHTSGWQGKYLATCSTGQGNFVFAVNLDGTVVAVLKQQGARRRVVLYFMPILSSSGKKEVSSKARDLPAVFVSPQSLCFTHHDTLLVADAQHGLDGVVGEISLTGVHLRTIGAGVFKSTVFGVACNESVIVVSQPWEFSNSITVFDTETGIFLRAFGPTGVCSIALTPDGTAVAFTVVLRPGSPLFGCSEVELWALTGERLRAIGGANDDDQTLYIHHRSVAVLSDNTVVGISSKDSCKLVIFPPDKPGYLFGSKGVSRERFYDVLTLTSRGSWLYVSDSTKRLQVFC